MLSLVELAVIATASEGLSWLVFYRLRSFNVSLESALEMTKTSEFRSPIVLFKAYGQEALRSQMI